MQSHERMNATLQEQTAERAQTSRELCAIAGLRMKQTQDCMRRTKDLYCMMREVLIRIAATTRVLSCSPSRFPCLARHLHEQVARNRPQSSPRNPLLLSQLRVRTQMLLERRARMTDLLAEARANLTAAKMLVFSRRVTSSRQS